MGSNSRQQDKKAGLVDDRPIELLSGVADTWKEACRILDGLLWHAQVYNSIDIIHTQIHWDEKDQHYHILVRDKNGKVY